LLFIHNLTLKIKRLRLMLQKIIFKKLFFINVYLTSHNFDVKFKIETRKFYFPLRSRCMLLLLIWAITHVIRTMLSAEGWSWCPEGLFPCSSASRLSIYSIAFRNISTFGKRWLGLLLVLLLSTSKASLTCNRNSLINHTRRRLCE